LVSENLTGGQPERTLSKMVKRRLAARTSDPLAHLPGGAVVPAERIV
jgi:hypothetical protein